MKMLRDGWNPYLMGALAGILSVGSTYYAGKYFGASTTFVRAAGFVEGKVAPQHASALEYLVKEAPKLDWQGMFLAGIFIGALASALLFRDFKLQAVPDMWKSSFGNTPAVRAFVAFLGGAVAVFGARLADG